jgi:transcriptional regulator with XRE-family HTH domain
MRAHSGAEAEFAARFADELRPIYLRAKRERKLNDLAKALGVSAPALEKYVQGNTMPGLNTIVLARRQLDIVVPFDGFDLAKLVSIRKSKQKMQSPQLELPFAIRALGPGKLDLKIRPQGTNRFQLELTFEKRVS